LKQDYSFDAIRLAPSKTVFEDRHVLDLDGTEVLVVHAGPSHQIGDTIIHVPTEKVEFAGDVIFRECTPMRWSGTYEKWLKTPLAAASGAAEVPWPVDKQTPRRQAHGDTLFD